ncbi:uncharacterized protein LOC120321621 [Drosophila yakuba]|uniref:uncharacterized protein LOC120321621 n=1 Tax=Drosophila yakuba TaxID=7245 RepID=UPI001C8A36EE|nr:uncharacterized protein LOC120321621 [Drosophila yakuba]
MERTLTHPPYQGSVYFPFEDLPGMWFIGFLQASIALGQSKDDTKKKRRRKSWRGQQRRETTARDNLGVRSSMFLQYQASSEDRSEATDKREKLMDLVKEAELQAA